MQNPGRVAFAVADLGNLDQDNILGLSQDLGASADHAMESSPALTVGAPTPATL